MPSFTWDVDPVIVHIGPFPLRYYGLAFFCVLAGGYFLLKWQIERAGGSRRDADAYVPYGLVGVFVGSRLGHVLFYDLDRALGDPLWVLKFWTGGLSSHGATIGIVLATAIYCWRRGVSALEGMDRFTYSAALGSALVRLGNFFNSEIVGRVTDQSWGVRFPRYDRVPNPPLRHPSQLYEFAMGLGVLGVLYLVDKRLGEENRPRGAMLATFFAVYFTGRAFVEYVKEYQAFTPDSALTMGQVLSLPAALAGYIGFAIALKLNIPAHWPKTDATERQAAANTSESE